MVPVVAVERTVTRSLNIVFVCTGNTCRSPMARIMFQQLLDERGLNWRVKSAGIAAADGAPAARDAVEVMKEHGLNLSTHEATLLTPTLVSEADLILTMTAAHKDAVRRIDPAAIEKTFSLREFVGLSGDVDDPVGRGIDVYRKTAAELRSLLAQAVQQLLRDGES